MMATWLQHLQQQDADLTTEQRLDMVRSELDALERRIAFIEATLEAIRAADEEERGA